MKAPAYRWSDLEDDSPVAGLKRKKVVGEHILVARIKLDKGSHVDVHFHDSEQIAMIMSGHVRWTIGANGSPDQYQLEMSAGEVLHLPSNLPHGIDILEDSEIIDLLSPVGPMGIDSHGR